MTPVPVLWPEVRPPLPRERVRVDRFLLVAVLVASGVRLPGLLATPGSDEAGFLMVARSWSPTGESLYGVYWVDRPPVLLAAYRWSDELAGGAGHVLGPRLLALLLAGVLVVCVHELAVRLVGTTPARVATVVVVALLSDPALSAWGAKGEVLGTPFVVLSWLLVVRALDRGSPRLALLAGVCAMTACGFKQSLVGGLVFGAVLLVASLLTGRQPVRPVLSVALRFAVGASLPVLACLAWIAVTPASFASGWYQVIGFRADASAVLAASASRAPVERAHELVLLFVVCGMAPVVLVAIACARQWWTPLSLALVAAFAVDLVAVVLSGSFWHAYLVPLVPGVALLAALAASCAPPYRSLARFAAALTVVAALAAYADFAGDRLVAPTSSGPWQVGQAISEVSARDDSIVSLYGAAELVEASGLPSPYEHLWSLPMRTLDPDLAQLRRVLSGPTAPVWVVAVLPLDSWHIDSDRRLRDLLGERYELVTPRCGPLIWLRADKVRPRPRLDC